jgi:hypothetical protein
MGPESRLVLRARFGVQRRFWLRLGLERYIRFDRGCWFRGNIAVKVFGLQRLGRVGFFASLLFGAFGRTLLATPEAIARPFTHTALVAHQHVHGQLQNSSVRDTRTIYNVCT